MTIRLQEDIQIAQINCNLGCNIYYIVIYKSQQVNTCCDFFSYIIIVSTSSLFMRYATSLPHIS
jgi:hypothetical protein